MNIHEQATGKAGFAIILFLSACSSDDAVKRTPSGNAGTDGGARKEHVYVTSTGADEVNIVDEATRSVTGHIPVGQFPAIILATPDHTKLYTANWGDDTLSAVSVATQKVTSIPLKGKPWVEAMSPDGKTVYAGLGSNEIAVISVESDTVVRSIPFDTLPASVIVSPDSETLYVAKLSDNSLEAISTTGDVQHESLTVGTAPAWITLSPDGGTVYTLNFVSGDVSVVDTTAWKVVATIPLGSDSAGIVGNVSPDGRVLCIADYGTVDLSAVDTSTNTATWKLPTKGRPVGIGFSPDGTRGFAGDYGEDSLAVTANDLIMALASMQNLRATSPGALTVFDPATGEKMGEPITVSPGPSSIVVLPD
jgi:YVTN family beta-propeller protein